MAGSDAVTWTADDKRLVLTLPNDRGAFEATRKAVMAHLEPHEPGPKLEYGVELVLEETLMNVIWHAFQDGAQHLIQLLGRHEIGLIAQGRKDFRQFLGQEIARIQTDHLPHLHRRAA
jgi:hypothetical protein